MLGLVICSILLLAGGAGLGSAAEPSSPELAPSHGLRGEYFANTDLRLPVALTRLEGPIDFDYGGGSPDPGLHGEHFSIRWTGQVQPEFSETYTFYTTSDDGVRLWIDGQPVIDNWTTHGPTEDSGSIELEDGGWVDLRLEFFERGGDALIRLEWSSDSTPREVIPIDRLQYPDFGGSSIAADPTSATADGAQTTSLTVTLADSSATPLSGVPLYLMIGGSHNFLNSSSVESTAWSPIGDTDLAGAVSAQLASTVAESKPLLLRAGDVVLPELGSVPFTAGPATSLQVLLPGESPDPGAPPGKGGVPDLPRIGQPTTVQIRAVDAFFNLADAFTGTATLSASDTAAQLPTSVDIADGTALAGVTWMTPGTQSLSASDTTDPLLVGSASVEVLGLQIAGLRGDYFPNPDLQAPPRHSSFRETIDFDFGLGSPDPSIPPDHFSARWRGRVQADFSEAYTFITTSDDGVRLWVDDQLLIDNWGVHPPPEDSGSLDLEAGRWYDLRLEYFDDDGDALIRLEWSSASTPRQVIPRGNLSFLDLEGAVLDLSPASAPADGTSAVTLDAQLVSEFNLALADAPVAIQLSGSGNLVNGSEVLPGAWTEIGVTDPDGMVSADLASTVPEAKVLRVRASEQILGSTASVSFASGPPFDLRLLLPGETGTPGQAPGKTGVPSPIQIGSGGTLIVQAVDPFFSMATSFTGDVRLTTTDPAADLPDVATLNNGETQVDFVLRTLGLQTITVTAIDGPPSTDESTVEVVPPQALVVGNGEVLTVDDARYRMTGSIPAGTPFVFYDGTPGFLPGDDVLIIAMQGDSIGTFDLAHVTTVNPGELVLSSVLLNPYDGFTNRVVIQRIPRFGEVVVQDGGLITAHAWDGSTGGVVAFRADSLTVAAGGKVDATGLGFRAGEGPGSGSFQAGGGHGGTGADYGGSVGGAGYGPPVGPLLLGSAGGDAGSGLDTGNKAGLTGGGTIFLEISGALQLDGAIVADGASRSLYFEPGPGAGGGAGGSVWITAGSLGGAGEVQALGGSSSTSDFDFTTYFGAGSGGRVDLTSDARGFSGQMRAWGGWPSGSPGTLVMMDLAAGQRTLRVDNFSRTGRPALLTDPSPTIWQFDSIELLRGGDLALLDPDDSIALTAAQMAGDGTAQLYIPASLAIADAELHGFGFFVPAGATLSLPPLVTVGGVELDVYGTLEGAGSLGLEADGPQNSRVRLSALGSHSGEPLGTYRFADLRVDANQTLELSGDSATGAGVTLIGDTVLVEPGGRVSGDGLGYQPQGNRGPGAGTSAAGHGGYGGGSTAGAPYGSALEPSDLGSASGGAGGGGIHMLAGSLTLDGTLSANGSSGGGAGGSLWLEVDALTGGGAIQANGGARNVFASTAGSGAGGRLALYTTTDGFVGTIQAAAGIDSSPSLRHFGGPGTIYRVDLSTGHRSLRVDNLGRDGKAAAITDPGPTTWAFEEITLTGQGDLELIDADDTVVVTAGNTSGDGTAQLQFHGSLDLREEELTGFGLQVDPGASLSLPAAFTLNGVALTNLGTIQGLSDMTVRGGSFVNRGLLDPLTSLRLVGGAQTSLVRLAAVGNTSAQDAGTYAVDTLLVSAAQRMELEGDASTGMGVTLLAGEVTVEGTGTVSADSLGYRPGVDRGPGYGGPGVGAGHGGFGGGVTGGSPYGSVLEPDDLGSAGGEFALLPATYPGAPGGGAVHVVADLLRIDGKLSANGGIAGPQQGGGAGGSLWIETSSFFGVGTIAASGGQSTRGAGAGGRIAIYAAANGFTGQLQAAGGPGSVGGAGTIYLEDTVSGATQLLVDNLGRIGPPAALTDPDPTDWTFGIVEIAGGGRLQLLDPDDSILLTNDNMQGDGSGQFVVVDALDLALTSLRGFGLLVRPGAALTLPPSFATEGVSLTNEGTLLGLSDLHLRAGQFTNLGSLPHLSSLTLQSMGGFNSTARLSSSGETAGQAQATYLIDAVQIDVGQTLELGADAANLNTVTLRVVNITVAGHLSADGLGYGFLVGASGPGAPLGAYGGAGHGGRGGGDIAVGGPGYGSVTEPASLGSAAGGAGGGGVHLIASHSILISPLGIVSANGLYSGGAGGSIWITANSLLGTGVIQANGGKGSPNTTCMVGGACLYRFSGAGGRIAIHAASNSFGGRIEARGGTEPPILPTVPTPAGGAGTVYLLNTVSGADRLLIDNGDLPGQRAILTDPATTHWSFDRLELRARGDLELADPTDTIELNLLNMLGDGTAQLFSHGLLSYSTSEMRGFGLHAYPGASLSLPASLTLNQVSVTNEGEITGLSALTLRGGRFTNWGAIPDFRSLILHAESNVNSRARFEAGGSSGGRPAAEYSLGDVQVDPNQVLELASDPVTGTGLRLRAIDLTVAGHLTADRLGYQPSGNLGPGAPTSDESGAGHGGRGGGTGGGPTYGSADEPVTLGSPGGYGAVAGGGAVRILLEGMLDVPATGRLSANGGAAEAVPFFNGGGSGGSLWITAPSIQGQGTIEANGGQGLGRLAGGGGGRVKLEAGFVSLDLTIRALGGAGTAPGEAGSAIVESIDFPTDVALTKSASAEAVPGLALEYSLVVRNSGLTTAEAVTLVDTLPPEVTYVSDNAPVPVSQSGAEVTWALGDLIPGQAVAFSAVVQVSDSAAVGSDLVNQATVSTTTNEIDLEDNSRQTSTRLSTGYDFEAGLIPVGQTLNLEGAGTYILSLRNTGILADRYTVEVSGLPSAWFSLSASEVPLSPGGEAEVRLSILVEDCAATGSHPFQVTVTPGGAAPQQTLDGQLSLAASVGFSDLRPLRNATVGSRDVLFAWRTDAPAVSTLRVYPAGRPAEARVFTTSEGLTQSVQVTGLQRNITYEWQVESSSSCGTASTTPQAFTVGNGIVFTQRELSVSINRDYDQRASMQIRNMDSLPHTVRVEIQHPYPDLIVNFIGSASIDQLITLLPGERRSVTLAFHAQDAVQKRYDLTAVLTADEATHPIRDTARIHVTVLFDADFTLEEIGVHPISGVRTYRVRNNGSPITDLAIRAVVPATGLPAQVLIMPAVNHAILHTGQSLTFQVHPLFGPDDLSAGPTANSGGPGLAAPAALGDLYDIVAMVGGAASRLQASRSCPPGTQLYPVTRQNVVLSFPASDWYCANDPSFTIPIDIPAFLRQPNIMGGTLQASFFPAAGVLPHSVQIGINGTTVLSPPYGVPRGTHTGSVPGGAIRATSLVGTTTQVIGLTSQHTNPGHLRIVTDFVLRVAASEVTVYVCATSQEEAEAIFDETYDPQPIPESITMGISSPVGDPVQPEADGRIRIVASVLPHLGYDYAVRAQMEYLDVGAGFSEEFLLFDDGHSDHGDLTADDGFYSTRWLPQAGGRVQLTVIASVPGLGEFSDTKTFTVRALSDLTVTRVWQNEVSLLNERAEVHAEIANLGFPIQGPIRVEFRYFNVDPQTGQPIGLPIHVTPLAILDGEVLGQGDLIAVVDDQFEAADLGIYYVVVVVDAP